MPHHDFIRSTNVTVEEIRRKLGTFVGDYEIIEESPGTFRIEARADVGEGHALALIERAFKLLATDAQSAG